MSLSPTSSALQHAHDRFRAQRFFGSLNGLRFVCIVAVMWHHSPLNHAPEGLRLLGRGFVGVDFFFVLSGFLITTLLLREEETRGRISIPQFYWRRALRILPVYFLLVTAMALYWIVVKDRTHLTGLVPYYYAFLANFLKGDIPLLSITWSLSIEEQYYLLWPAILLLLPTLPWLRVRILVAAILVCLLAMLGLADWLNLPVIETEHARFILPGMSYSAILMGSLTAVLMQSARGYALVHRVTSWRGAPVVWFVLLLLFLQLAPFDLRGWPAFVMDILMALTLASLVVREDHVARPVLSARPVARIGEISYGLYLYHLIGLHIANELARAAGLVGQGNNAAVSLVYPFIAVALAEVSFRVYETRFLRLKTLPARWRAARRAEG